MKIEWEQRVRVAESAPLSLVAACCQTAERNNTKQFFRFRRNRSETVLQTGTECLYVFIQHQTVQFTIKQHTFATARHVISRQ